MSGRGGGANVADNNVLNTKRITVMAATAICSAILIGSNFEMTDKAFASHFYTLQYPDSNSTDVKMYGRGMKDALTLFFFALMTIVIQSMTEDAIEQATGNRPVRDDIQTIFYGISIVIGLVALIHGSPERSDFWNGGPDATIPYLLKFFYLIQLAYYIPLLISSLIEDSNLMKMKAPMFDTIAVTLVLFVTYCIDYSQLTTALLIIHCVVGIFQMMTKGSKAMAVKVLNIGLFAVECLLDLSAAICIYKYAETRGQYMKFGWMLAAVAWIGISVWFFRQFIDGGDLDGRNSKQYVPLAPLSPKKRRRRSSNGSRGRKGSGDVRRRR